MIYIHEETGRYPVTDDMLRKENPGVSFPEEIPQDILDEHGLKPVTVDPRPDYDPDYEVVALPPMKINGKWTVKFTRARVPDEVKWESVRAYRNTLLNQSDWTQLRDVSGHEAWAAYRQALRDVTKQPDPFNIDWPTAP